MSNYQKNSGNKWSEVDKSDNEVNNSYRPSYAQKSRPRYSPKKSVRSFRDLDVYQRTMECAVLVQNDILPILEKDGFRYIENMSNCMLGIPLLIAEAHGQRFSDFNKAVMTLESAMQGCNKMVVYLDQGAAFSYNLEKSLADDVMQRYMTVRGKMLRLLRSWQKFRNQT